MDFEAPINKGHRFANQAEDFEETEKWTEAVEAHANAAEQFEIAMKDTADIETIRTLRLLSTNHKRKSKDLYRRLQRIKAAANKQKEAGLPMQTHRPYPEELQQQQQHTVHNTSQTGSSESAGPPAYKQMAAKATGPNDHKISEIGESYALLSNDDHEDDPFNKFLEAVESLVQQLLNPAVAFTSAPLNENDNPLPPGRAAQLDALEQHLSLQHKSKKPNKMAGSYFMVPIPGKENHPTYLSGNSRGHSEEMSIDDRTKRAMTDEEYITENELLRKQLDQLQDKLKALELSAEENNMLKSSVLQFRNDVHKQAKRIMQTQHETNLMRSSVTALLLNQNQTNHHLYKNMHGTTATIRYSPTSVQPSIQGNILVSRLLELEDEHKKLKLQNEKQRLLMNKYKERWEMLKENAKKRRPTSATTASPQSSNDHSSMSSRGQQYTDIETEVPH